MTAKRNKLIHDWLGVDLRLVWRVIQEDLPPLRAQMAPVVPDLPTGDTDAG
jgi:uncharacterized protein with HEPN domain